MTAPAVVVELVERFETHCETYCSDRYNEAQLRQEFLNPLFEALGWDVYNKKGHSEAYKEVIHEYSLKVGGRSKAPDYCFRIGRDPILFVEAKKPFVDIGAASEPACQLRSYGWNRSLPASILTDFKEFAVYDCRVRPLKSDKASTARILLRKYTEYVEHWDELAGLFSPNAIRRGALDRFLASEKIKKGTERVDAAFLDEIEGWRDLLARHIAVRNRRLSSRDLNFAVQATIDRLVFLRICEDRGIEPYGTLQSLLNGPSVYRRLGELFQQADQRYNSGLFYFSTEKGRREPPDELTLALDIDDKPLKAIIKDLYDNPYEFSVLPVEILGQAYEQFLGKVIRLTAGHQAKVEEKPEVRKAGGVYYTPVYVVDYIVEHTVGKLVEGKTPQQAARLRVLDPACGSGSFLIGAYQYLLDWHHDWYEAHAPEKHARGRRPQLYRGRAGEWRLTTTERKRILLNNIFGVDIDPQAVEVTKLSLLLKVLEGESQESLATQLRLFHERALPDLAGNIKCGNSLIGYDFDASRQTDFLSQEHRDRISMFDWKAEFTAVFKGKEGGFDAVIGNPPWGADIDKLQKAYFRSKYRLNSGKFESYIFFLEKASSLLNQNGCLGFVLPSYWISRSQTAAVRAHLLGCLWPESLVVLPENVFAKVKMDSTIIVAGRKRSEKVLVAEIQKNELHDCQTSGYLRARCRKVDVRLWEKRPVLRFNPRITSEDVPILAKCSRGATPLGQVVDITQGLTLYRRSTLAKMFGRARAEEIVAKRLFHSHRRKDKTYRKELLGRDVARYAAVWNGESWVSYGPWLAHAVANRFFRGPRLVIQKLRNPMLTQRLVVGYLDDNETYSAGVLLNAICKPEQRYHLYYLMGLLNSKAINYWYRKCVMDVSIRVVDLRRVPVRTIDFSKRSDKSRHDRMVQLVERMLGLHHELSAARTAQDKTAIQRQIDAADAQIDHLVYELYGLSDAEIVTVEEATGGR